MADDTETTPDEGKNHDTETKGKGLSSDGSVLGSSSLSQKINPPSDPPPKDLREVERMLSSAFENFSTSTERLRVKTKELLRATNAFYELPESLQRQSKKLEEATEMLSAALNLLEVPRKNLLAANQRLHETREALEAPSKKLESTAERLSAAAEGLGESSKSVVATTGELSTVTTGLQAANNGLLRAGERPSSNLKEPQRQDIDISGHMQELITSIHDLVSGTHGQKLNQAAAESFDGKPSFSGLLHLHHTSMSDVHLHHWQGLTLHAHDRPFNTRILMQHILTAISNHHPKESNKAIELTEVAFVWDCKTLPADDWDSKAPEKCLIRGRGDVNDTVQENSLVSDSLEAMMARGGHDHIYVKYHFRKVDHDSWARRMRVVEVNGWD